MLQISLVASIAPSIGPCPHRSFLPPWYNCTQPPHQHWTPRCRTTITCLAKFSNPATFTFFSHFFPLSHILESNHKTIGSSQRSKATDPHPQTSPRIFRRIRLPALLVQALPSKPNIKFTTNCQQFHSNQNAWRDSLRLVAIRWIRHSHSSHRHAGKKNLNPLQRSPD